MIPIHMIRDRLGLKQVGVALVNKYLINFNYIKVNEEDGEGEINVFQFKIETDAYSIPEHEIADMRSIGHG